MVWQISWIKSCLSYLLKAMFSSLKGKGYTIRKRGMIANRQLSNNDNYHANLKKETIGHRRNNPYRKVSYLFT